MNQSVKVTLRLLFVLVSSLAFHKSEAMKYQDQLDLEDLNSLFSEDGCVEGTLSATQTGGPFLKTLSFTESKYSATLNEHQQNKPSDIDSKSPMSLINELATFNNIKLQYTLIDEQGPSHQKHFSISLALGEEKYYAEGRSIKKAQHEAAKQALNSTSYLHPPEKPSKSKIIKYNKTPVEKLNDWARKHGDVKLKYLYTVQSGFGFSGHYNNYHKGMYSKPENVYKVTIIIDNQKFIGEGPTSEIAKKNAANNALKQLQNLEGFCMFDNSEANIFDVLFNSDSNNYSPISRVFEFASKSKLKASFDLISEEGPAHLKQFVYKCNIEDKFETFGEGSCKKAAKTKAAERMIEKLKSHVSYNEINCGSILKKKKKSNVKKSRNLVKSVENSNSNDEINSKFSFPDDINPISKLMEIQQRNHEVEPVFRLIEERGQTTKEFFIEVIVGDLSFVGSGPNKKTAKRKAAEGILEKMGYSTVTGKIRFSSSVDKNKEFTDNHISSNKKPLGEGLSINLESSDITDNSKSYPLNQNKFKDSTKFKDKSTTLQNNIKNKDTKNSKKSSDIRPVTHLKNLAQQFGFRFQFSDFPKGNNSGFVSLLSLTTDPPKVCYGTGATTELSQDSAALSGIESLNKSYLASISHMLRETAVPEEEENLIDETNMLKPIVHREKD